MVRQRRSSATHDGGESNGNPENDHLHISDLSQLEESSGMSQLSRHVTACVNRDYYDYKSCSWILYALSLLCSQILFISFTLFVILASNSPTVESFKTLSSLTFLVFLSANYLFILVCLIYENNFSRKGHHWVYGGTMGVVLGLGHAFWWLTTVNNMAGVRVSIPMVLVILAISAPLPLLWYD